MTDSVKTWRPIVGSAVVSALGLARPNDLGGLAVVLWAFGCAVVLLRSAKTGEAQAKKLFRLLGSAALLIAVGFVVRAIHGEIVGQESPIPSPADLIHIPAYLMFFLAVRAVHDARARGPAFDAWLDALALATSSFLLLWALFLSDFAVAAELSLGTRVVNSIYTIVILATFTLFIRLTSTPGHRPPSYYLLGLAAATFFVAELAGTYSLLHGSGLSLAIALSPFVYGLIVAAVLHPSADLLMAEHEEREFRVGPLRLVLVGATIIAPLVVTFIQPNRHPFSAAVTVVAAIWLASLIVLRVTTTLRRQQEVADLDRSLGSEISKLASKTSSSDVVEDLPRSARCVLPNWSTPTYSAEPSSSQNAFTLPENLRQDDRTHLLFEDRHMRHVEKRVIEDLIEDADLIAASVDGVAAIAHNASQAKAMERIAQNEHRFRALLQNSADTIVVFDKETGVVTFVSESVEHVLGYRTQDFLGKTLEWVTYKKDWEFAVQSVRSTQASDSHRTEYETRVLHSDGSIRLLHCSVADMTDVEGIQGIVMNATDRTQIRELESDLLSAETLDPLTSLLNRQAFIKEIEAAARRASVRKSSVAIAVIDIDDFRSVNDGYGTAVGDRVLLKLASRIKRVVRNDDAICRLSGDRFGVMFPTGYSTSEVEGLLERILEAIKQPVDIEGHTVVLSATSGVFIDNEFDSDAVTVLGHADTALDAAKQAHRGGLLHFRSEMGLEASTRIEIRNRLRLALNNDGLRLNFQPIVDLESGEIVSLEALARWHDPTLGEISPGTFIPVAESSGLISDLGAWALRRACEHLCEWDELGFDHITVSVNMSGHQLRDDRTVDQVRSILKETGVAAARITIELTESVLLDDTNFTAERIRKLRRLGLRLAIDDFGTGYSSFGYLRRYVFDIVKIDRSFVAPLRDDKNVRDREIVNAMVKLSQALGATTIGEGVERSEEHGVLRTLGCEQAQGYLFFGPTEAREIPELLGKQVNPAIVDL